MDILAEALRSWNGQSIDENRKYSEAANNAGKAVVVQPKNSNQPLTHSENGKIWIEQLPKYHGVAELKNTSEKKAALQPPINFKEDLLET